MQTINDDDYQHIVELMDAAMFQFSASSVEEAINEFAFMEPEKICAIVDDIDRLLEHDISPHELTAFVLRHSDYLIGDDGQCTLKNIRHQLIKLEPST